MIEPSEETKQRQKRLLESRMCVWANVRRDADTYLGIRFDPLDCDYMPMPSIAEAVVSAKLDVMNALLRRIVEALEAR